MSKKRNAANRREKSKRGGQKGHTRKLRQPLPPERVDEQVTCEISNADVRELDLTPTDQLLDRSRLMFSAWHRRDEMTDAGFYRSMVTHRARFLEVVLKPPNSTEASKSF